MNAKLSALLVVTLAASASAQIQVRWLTEVDGGGANSDDFASVVALGASGEYYVAGSRGTSPPWSVSDPFVARVAPNGTTQWTATLSTPPSQREGVRAIALSPLDGSVHVLSSPVVLGQAGMVLARFDPITGTPTLTTSYGGAAVTTYAVGLAIDAAGNTYVAGSIGATAVADSVDMYLESRDAANVLRWSHVIDGGASKADFVSALAPAPGGQFVVVGTANQVQSGASDATITRFDAAGNILWTRTRNVVPGALHGFQELAVDASNGTAYALETVSAPPGSATVTSIVAYDAAGNFLFDQSLPAGASAFDLDVGAGAVVVAGGQTGVGGGAFAARYTYAGALEWTRVWSIAGPSNTTAWKVRIDASGVTTCVGVASTPLVQNTHKDLALARFAPDGTQISTVWIAAPGNYDDLPNDLVVDGTGSPVIVGTRRPFVFQTSTPANMLVVRLEPQSFALCLGDGTGAACPCGNTSVLGSQAGCTNSSGNAARMSDNGTASLSNDTLSLSIGGETANASTVVIQGTTSANSTVFGDGLRCAGGVVRRLYTRNASSGVVNVPPVGDLSVSARATALGDVLAPGSTRVYQSYYRDPNPTFCASPTGNTWNLSNGLLVRWVP